MTELPERTMITFSSEQKAVIESRSPMIVVDAGAGVGKTTVLKERVECLVREGVPPSSIVALSFTKDSADELKDRINAPVHSRTLHSFALRILRMASRIGPRNNRAFPDFRIVMEDLAANDVRGIFIRKIEESSIAEVPASEVLKEMPGDTNARKKRAMKLRGFATGRKRGEKADMSTAEGELISKVLSIVDLYFMRGVKPDPKMETGMRMSMLLTGNSIVQIGGGFYRAKNVPLMDIISEIGDRTEAAMHEKDHVRIRMSMLPTLAARICRGPHWEQIQSLMFGGHISNLLVDEVQDIDDGQVDFINALNAESLFIVGDTNQSLYAFRYVVPDVIRRARELFPAYAARGMTTFELTINRRCPEDVLEAANRLIGNNGETKNLRVCDDNAGTSGIEVINCYTYDEYLNSLTENIINVANKESGKEPDYRNIVILSRYMATLEDMEPFLLAKGIPAKIRRERSFLDSHYTDLFIAFVNLALKSHLSENFFEIVKILNMGLHKERSISFNKGAYKFVENRIMEGQSVIEAVRELGARNNFMKMQKNDTFRTLLSDMEDIVEIVHADLPAPVIVTHLYETETLKSWLEDQTHDTGIEEMKAHMNSIASHVYDMFDFVDLVSVHKYYSKSNSNSVTLTTLHASKGLEWDNVFFTGLEREVFPRGDIIRNAARIRPPSTPYEIQSTGDLSEERRMAYVGMTRARKKLWMIYTCQRMNRRTGKMMETSPSMFFHESGINSRYHTMTFRGNRGKSRNYQNK